MHFKPLIMSLYVRKPVPRSSQQTVNVYICEIRLHHSTICRRFCNSSELLFTEVRTHSITNMIKSCTKTSKPVITVNLMYNYFPLKTSLNVFITSLPNLDSSCKYVLRLWHCLTTPLQKGSTSNSCWGICIQ